MNPRLLLVDDNEPNRDMLSRRLIREGYEVTTASGGHEALALVKARPFDLVLCDVMMPEISGLDVLETLRRSHSIADLPVIMVTAKNQSEDVVEALRRGANDYVAKPIDFPVLLARLRTHLALRQLSALKDEFLRMASHDLKNPLTEILGVSSLLSLTVPAGATMPENMARLVRNVSTAARRMQFMIEDFLDFQASEDGVLKLSIAPVDVNTLIDEVVETATTTLEGKRQTIRCELDGDLPTLPADSRRIAQVIQNLLDNAMKYSPPGGAITLRSCLDGDRVRVAISDSGPGLRDEDFKQAFQKYARLSNTPTGGEKSSGLGLAICKQLVEAHHGRIGVENHTGAPGATFWFELPLTTAPEQPRT